MTWCFDVFFFNLPDFDVEQVNVHAEARREGSRTEPILSSSFRKWPTKMRRFGGIVIEKKKFSSRLGRTVSNSPKPSRVYIRLCKHRKKVFYCFYKITFPRNNAQLFVMALIKREILTSRKVLYSKSCTRNQFLLCKKMLFFRCYSTYAFF